MKNFIFILGFWLFNSETSLANVQLSVEPYIGYSKMSIKQDNFSDSQMASVLGGKGGFSLGKWAFYLDFHFGGPYLFEDNNNDYTHYMWGAGVNYSWKKIRTYAGYYFRNTLEDVERNIKYTGSGIKVSFGLTFESRLSINLEFIKQTFNQLDASQLNTSTANLFELESTVAFFTISAPISR